MSRLGQRDLRRVLEALRALYSARTAPAFRRDVLGIVAGVVDCDFSSYNEVDQRRRRIAWIVEPADALVPNLEPVFAVHMHQHPFLAHHRRTGDGGPRRISDFLTRRQFHRLALYNEVYRRTGVEHQIALALPAAPSVAIVALDRGREAFDFTERERRLLDLLRPHLAQASRNAEVFSESQRELTLLGNAVGSLGRGVVLLRGHGRRISANDHAERPLARYFGRSARRGSGIPDALRAWLRKEEALLAVRDEVPRPRTPLLVEGERGRLVVRLLSDPGVNLLLLEEQTGPIGAENLRRLGLTRREAEVLAWVARGKTNAEVASVLGTSPKTVGKHLERIYQTLGVETRTAALIRAFEVTDEPEASAPS